MTESVARYLPIGDYAVIGNCRSAALVGRNGALDWLCLPRFDSPSVFGALLDAGRGGRFQICPSDAYRTERRYIPDTNVLETTFHTPSGVCRLLDLMPLTAPEMDSRALRPEHEVLRAIEGVSGSVRLNIVYEPRPDYARQRPRLRTRGRLGLWCAAGPGALTLLSDVPLSVAPDGASARGSVTVEAGAWRSLSLAYAETAPAVIAPLGRAAQARIEQTVRWWQLWAARCRYAGPYRAAVVRSALTLKLMSYAPSGAIIAAPTTSLPERIGGERNWDYRYCWLRDASFTLRALLGLGYHEEGESFLGWMMHATSLTWPELQVVYDVFGRMRLPERELKHLDGYAGSRPVRIGNDAHGQLQLDVYGEVIDAVARYVEAGGAMDGETARMLTSLGETVCRRWREPDEGIWEVRGGRAQHTHSKVLCWVALDRLIALYESGRLTAPVARFRQERGRSGRRWRRGGTIHASARIRARLMEMTSTRRSSCCRCLTTRRWLASGCAAHSRASRKSLDGEVSFSATGPRMASAWAKGPSAFVASGRQSTGRAPAITPAPGTPSSNCSATAMMLASLRRSLIPRAVPRSAISPRRSPMSG